MNFLKILLSSLKGLSNVSTVICVTINVFLLISFVLIIPWLKVPINHSLKSWIIYLRRKRSYYRKCLTSVDLNSCRRDESFSSATFIARRPFFFFLITFQSISFKINNGLAFYCVPRSVIRVLNISAVKMDICYIVQ